MSRDEKNNMKGPLSDLLAKAKENEGLDPVLFRDEIIKESASGDKTLEKFLELVESFQDVLPKEKQRYSVAVRALRTTSGISRQKVLESTDSQLEALGRLEEGVLSDLTAPDDELSDMDSRLQKTKSELAELREKVAALVKEEREILGVMAARERKRKAVEDTVRKVFTDVSAEISGIKKKIEEFTGEKVKVSPEPAAQPDVVESHEIEEEEGEEVEAKGLTMEETFQRDETFPRKETKWLKKCPVCGGDIIFLVHERKWTCYTCGHEEAGEEET
jgi:ribosomal protein S27AE/chromosome segregation ATPase